ncbi:hypothetical protein H6776_02450 [Candidatus Nomurabacteria bacterium]|nr:hypothetical protein [Candidatus Nomurabacteria bacterium]
MQPFGNNKKAHFIGLCGAGMSAVAHLLDEVGYEISGSDQGVYDPIKSYLEKCNLTCSVPHNPTNIPNNVDTIVIGRHAKLVPESNAEVARAFEKFPNNIKSFPEVLGEITQDTQNFVIAGSYGKSTTTALLTWAMQQLHLDPGYFIGALPIDFEYTSGVGGGKYFVLEGDEYPSSNWDNTSKFLHYHASSVLLISGEHDHVNVFPTLEEYLAPYQQLMRALPQGGYVVGCIDNPHVAELMSQSQAKGVSYGFDPRADFTISDIQHEGALTHFQIMHLGKSLGTFSTQLLGKHNVQNICGVVAFMLTHGLCNAQDLVAPLRAFRGITRRLDRKSDIASIHIYEGFGSSYTKARTAITALQEHFPDQKLFVLFEPHTFSWRNRQSLDWYHTVFDGVDTVALYPPPGHGATSHDQLSHKEIIDEVKAHFRGKVLSVCDFDSITETLKNNLQARDVLLILTSGSFDGKIAEIVGWCENNFIR